MFKSRIQNLNPEDASSHNPFIERRRSQHSFLEDANSQDLFREKRSTRHSFPEVSSRKFIEKENNRFQKALLFFVQITSLLLHNKFLCQITSYKITAQTIS